MNKFSINLSDADLKNIDAFKDYWNSQSLVRIGRADSIRMLIRAGAREQAYIPGALIPTESQTHLSEGGQPACGSTGNSVDISHENCITCPKCKLLARHHESKDGPR